MSNRQILNLANALILGSMLAITGCSKTIPPNPIPTATQTPTPAKILEISAQKVSALETLSFKLVHESGSTPLMEGVLIKNITGNVVVNKAFEVQIDAEALGITALRINILATNGRVHMTDPISQKWREIDSQDTLFDFTNLGDTLAQILRTIKSPKQTDGESLKNDSYLQLSGTILSENLQPLIPGAADNLEVRLEIVIRSDDFVLTQARISGPVTSTDPEEIVRILSFYNFNEPMEIRTPPIE